MELKVAGGNVETKVKQMLEVPTQEGKRWLGFPKYIQGRKLNAGDT